VYNYKPDKNNSNDREKVTFHYYPAESRRLVRADGKRTANTSREPRPEPKIIFCVGSDGNARYSIMGMFVPCERKAARFCEIEVEPRLSLWNGIIALGFLIRGRFFIFIQNFY